MRILFIGDVFGKPGRLAVYTHLPRLIARHDVDFCVANCENAKGGRGLTGDVAERMYESGVNVITLGNHAWDNKKIFSFIDQDARLVRAYNYPHGVPGRGLVVTELRNGLKIAVGQLLCRLFMKPVECPFRCADAMLDEARDCQLAVIDVHGEATSEKQALGWYLDGRATAVIGTHTHVPTADERVLPGGTAYITDAGMSGPADSVIGMDIDFAIANFLSPLPNPFTIARNNVKIAGVLVDADEATGKARSIERLLVDASGPAAG